mgnify:CR=1 FL=1
MKKYLGGALLLLGLLLILPGTTALAEDGRQIAKGVTIGNMDMSDKTVSEAQEMILAYFDKLSNGEITLKVSDDKTLTITGAELGISWSNPQVIEEAYSLGHRGNVVERYMALKDLEYGGYSFSLEYGFDEDSITDIVENRCSSFNQEKVNYSLTKTSSGFTVTEGQTGYFVDTQESANVIREFIQSGWDGEAAEINLVVKEDVPLGSSEELSKVRDVLGTFTTSYKTSGAARSANVANGCSLLNGITLYPGEELSVLANITPFTEANGYYPAGSYLNGLVVESIGGGICQVSTTLYNAVLLAELEVTERHNHSMIVTYVSPSADAAIAESGGKDFKFVNSTDYPIYIEGTTTSDKNITFTIYGVETRTSDRSVTYKSEVLETTPASADQFVTDSSQAVGYVGTQSAHIGYKAQLKKIVTENGQTTEEVVNSSNYKMVPRIISVGTAGADANDLAQLQTAIATGDVATVKSVAGALAAAKSAAGTENAEAAALAAAAAVNAANAQLQQQSDAAATQAAEDANQDVETVVTD